MRKLPTEREEFESNCVYVIWYHDYYNPEDHLRKCVCLTDKEYLKRHAAIVEMYSECGPIETRVYMRNACLPMSIYERLTAKDR